MDNLTTFMLVLSVLIFVAGVLAVIARVLYWRRLLRQVEREIKHHQRELARTNERVEHLRSIQSELDAAVRICKSGASLEDVAPWQ